MNISETGIANHDYILSGRLLILSIFLLNISDAIYTWLAVSSGKAYELNFIPILLLSYGPLVFFTVKIGTVSIALAYLAIRITEESVKKYQVILIIITIIFILISVNCMLINILI
jgi:hypothetical protein